MGDNVAETLEVMETMRVFFWKIVILHPFLWQFMWFLFVFPHIAMESHFSSYHCLVNESRIHHPSFVGIPSSPP